jgi:hypothetical protein
MPVNKGPHRFKYFVWESEAHKQHSIPIGNAGKNKCDLLIRFRSEALFINIVIQSLDQLTQTTGPKTFTEQLAWARLSQALRHQLRDLS